MSIIQTNQLVSFVAINSFLFGLAYRTDPTVCPVTIIRVGLVHWALITSACFVALVLITQMVLKGNFIFRFHARWAMVLNVLVPGWFILGMILYSSNLSPRCVTSGAFVSASVLMYEGYFLFA